METITKDTISVITPSGQVLNVRVYTGGAWVWIDLTSRLVKHGPVITRIERTHFMSNFDACVNSIELDNSDGYFDPKNLMSVDGGIWNDAEPYGKRLRGRWFRVGRKYTYPDGTTTTVWLGCGTVEDAKGSNEGATITLSLQSLSRRAMEQKADGEKANAHAIYGDWVDPYATQTPTGTTPLYAARTTETETSTIKRTWFENRKIKDVLQQICNSLDDANPVIDDILLEGGDITTRICSTLTRPPANDYPSASVYCRAIAWDDTNTLLWVACDDPDNLNNAYIYKYDTATEDYTRVAKISGSGRVFKMWLNRGTDPSVVNTLAILCTASPIPGGAARATANSYVFKLSTTSAYVELGPGDVLATLVNLCPGTFNYRRGACTSELYNGIQTSSLIGADVQDHGGGNRRLSHFAGENLHLPFQQRLTPRINVKPWTKNGAVTQSSVRDGLLLASPNRWTSPPAVYVPLPESLAAGNYRVRSGRWPLSEGNDWVYGNLQHSFGQDGTTIFVQTRSAGKGSIVFMTYGPSEPPASEYRMYEVNLGTGAITDHGHAGDDTMQFTFLCARCSGTVIVGGYLVIDDYDQLHNSYKFDFRIHQWTDAGGWGLRWTHSYNWMILEAIEVDGSEILACVYNRETGEYQVQLINCFGGSFPGTPVLKAGGGNGPPVSGRNQFRGFVKCDSTIITGGDDRWYFYETGPYLLYSFDLPTRSCRAENTLGESSFPIVEGESNGASNLAVGYKAGDWVLFGISCKQYMDKDGSTSGLSALPYVSDAECQYILWQYAKQFSGYLQLLDFEGMTLHDVRVKLAEMLHAVFFYDPAGTFYFKARPVSKAGATVKFTDVCQIAKTSEGYKDIINSLSCIPYHPSIMPQPTSIPYVMRTAGSTGTLARCVTNYDAPRVEEWRFLFVSDTAYSVVYRISGTTVWLPASPGTGDINSDYRGVYIGVPSSAWSGITKEGDIYGFYIYPPVKKLEQLTEREKIEYRDLTSEAKYGRQEQAIDNKLMPRILVPALLENIVTYAKDPHALYNVVAPLYDSLCPLNTLFLTDARYGTGCFWVNELSISQDDPTMKIEAIAVDGGDLGGWTGEPT